MKYLFRIFFFCLFISTASYAEAPMICDANDTICMSTHISNLASKIEKDRWRDQTYRELAKSIAANGHALDAIKYIDLIKNPDTKALTIRGIGIEAAQSNTVPNGLFEQLKAEANKITDPPSYGIALTYIAMAQAIAGDDAGAAQTASNMKNEDLRNKAYAETAEIQAQHGKFADAQNSISSIQSLSFKNKAYKSVASIFADNQKYQESLEIAVNITNPVMQAEAVQYILDTQRISKEKVQTE